MNSKPPYNPIPPAALKELLAEPYAVIFLDNDGEKTNFVRVKQLSVDEFKAFENARDIINDEVLQYNDLFLMVATAHDSFTQAYESRVEAASKDTGFVSVRDDLVELNTHFVSLIANFSMYLSCVAKKISSERADILKIHTVATNEEYDNCFGYRLVANLRNYSLHHTPPITGIRGSKHLGGEPEYEIYIEKEQLLKDSQIAKKLAVDFKLEAAHYPVLENIDEAVASLSRIHWKTIKALMNEIPESLSVIKSLQELTKREDKQPYVAAFSAGSGGVGTDVQLSFVPTHVLDIYENAQRY